MSIELPGWLTEPFSLIGMTWPEADEDLLNAAGDKWSALAADLDTIARSAHNAVQPVMDQTTGDAAEAFDRWWTGPDGPDQRLGDDSDAARLLGGCLTGFAALTVTLKLAWIAQLAILAAEIAQAVATAFFSFGATLAEVPGFAAATRVICKRALQELLDHLTTVIKDIIERAKGLFKKLGSREARTADEQLLQTGVRMRPRAPDRLQKWSDDAYDAIRADHGDVDAIYDNLPPDSPFTRGDIDQIKQHVFHDEHLLDRYPDDIRTGQFDSNPDMAEAWMRLRDGDAVPEDYTLLHHELAESTYMADHPGAGYTAAHDHANGVATWEPPAPGRTDLDAYPRP